MHGPNDGVGAVRACSVLPARRDDETAQFEQKRQRSHSRRQVVMVRHGMGCVCRFVVPWCWWATVATATTATMAAMAMARGHIAEAERYADNASASATAEQLARTWAALWG